MTIETRPQDGTSVEVAVPDFGAATRARSDGHAPVIAAFDPAMRRAGTAPFRRPRFASTRDVAWTSPAAPPPPWSDLRNEKLAAAGAPMPR